MSDMEVRIEGGEGGRICIGRVRGECVRNRL